MDEAVGVVVSYEVTFEPLHTAVIAIQDFPDGDDSPFVPKRIKVDLQKEISRMPRVR